MAKSTPPQLKDNFRVSTYFHTTLMTQNSTLLHFLHWRHAVFELQIPTHTLLFEFINYVPPHEIANFVHGLLDSIFDMMEHFSSSSKASMYGRPSTEDQDDDSNLYDMLFKAFVRVLHVTTIPSTQFAPFHVLVDSYIENWLQSTHIWKPILDSFMRLLQLDDILAQPQLNPSPLNHQPQQVQDQSKHKHKKLDLKNAIIVWGYWIKLVVRSGLCFQINSNIAAGANFSSNTSTDRKDEKENDSNSGNIKFEAVMSQMLAGISELMMLHQQEAESLQILILNYIPNLLHDLARVFGPLELISIIVKFVDSMANISVNIN